MSQIGMGASLISMAIKKRSAKLEIKGDGCFRWHYDVSEQQKGRSRLFARAKADIYRYYFEVNTIDGTLDGLIKQISIRDGMKT
jgi:hypothetical protein